MEQEMILQVSPQAVAQKYCAQCGDPARLEARFCQNCGLDMVAASPAFSSSDPGHTASAGDVEPGSPSPGMSLGTAWMIYMVAVLVLLGTCVIPVGPAFLPIYLITGFVMTRFVMRNVIEFHPVYSTVANVFSAKLGMFLLWPLQMGILLIKLTVNSSL